MVYTHPTFRTCLEPESKVLAKHLFQVKHILKGSPIVISQSLKPPGESLCKTWFRVTPPKTKSNETRSLPKHMKILCWWWPYQQPIPWPAEHTLSFCRQLQGFSSWVQHLVKTLCYSLPVPNALCRASVLLPGPGPLRKQRETLCSCWPCGSTQLARILSDLPGLLPTTTCRDKYPTLTSTIAIHFEPQLYWLVHRDSHCAVSFSRNSTGYLQFRMLPKQLGSFSLLKCLLLLGDMFC